MNTTTFGALAEPNRLKIVEMLRSGPSSVGDIASRLLLRQPLVSSHLKILSKAGLVKSKPAAQRRMYELQAKPFEELGTWVDTFGNLWEQRLDVFEAQLHTLKNDANHGDKHVKGDAMQ